MKTIIINTGVDVLNYPIGNYIDANKPEIIKLAKALGDIEEFKNKDLNLICRGSSGAIIAAMFAMILQNKCYIIHIKKEGEESHSGSFTMRESAKNIIVDDFIITGETMRAIYAKLIEVKPDIEIDCLCVSGTKRVLSFNPKYYICC